MWADRNCLLFLSADVVSQFGSKVTYVALPLLAVLKLDASPIEVGALVAAEMAAFLVIGLPAGVWVDHLPRRATLIWADVIRGAALLSIPAMVGHITMPYLYCVALLVGACTVFFDVTRLSYLPSIVKREHLVAANSGLGASMSVTELSGPAFGGWLVHALTAPVALLADALSYFGSALLLSRIRGGQEHRTTGREQRLLSEIAEGFRFVLGHPVLAPITMSGAVNMFSYCIWIAAQPLFLIRDLGVSPGLYGLLLSGVGAGGVAGALSASWMSHRLGTGRTLYWTAIAVLPSILLAPLSAPGWRLWLFVLGAAVHGFGGVLFNVVQLSYRQSVTPDHLLGRMNATFRFVVWGAMPFGALTGAIVGQVLGTHTAILVGAIGMALAGLPVVASSGLRRPDALSRQVTDAPADDS